MRKVKLTVLKKMYNEEYARKYTKNNAPICESFEVGEEFLVENAVRPPDDFCAWAWIDIQRSVQTLLRGGNFSDTGWMKNENELIVACSDGIRPVIFKLEKMDDKN